MSAAHDDLKIATAEYSRRATETTAARDAELVAQAAFDADGGDKKLDALMRARLKRERLERLVSAAQADVDKARGAVERAEEATAQARYLVASALSASWRTTVLPEIRELVELDKQRISAIVGRIADKVVAAQDAWVEADALANQLHIDDFHTVKPKMKAAKLLAQVAITRARKSSGLDPIVGWIDSIPEAEDLDWRDDDSRIAHEAAVAALTKGSL